MSTDIGDRIARLRKQMNINQREMAKQLGVSPSTIGMYEQGRRIPKNVHLVKLSRIFGVSIDYILTGNENAPTSSDGKYAYIVEQVEKRLNVAEPSTLLKDESGLRSLTRDDIEFLCDAFLSAQAELDGETEDENP